MNDRNQQDSTSTVYLTAFELRKEIGRFQVSPFPAWSPDDIEWLRGMDDASGDYGDVADPRPPVSLPPRIGTAEVQLALFN
ncbi:hypothetical protein [Halomonas sp. I5-271120]|uniref:hypothetical protein n=1 Tax=Halomonas sp. I5-271120 TaxID=3061632 RepID=UPI0027147488|nr:hypothetical protein [Halomonas sp. I5-271120]